MIKLKKNNQRANLFIYLFYHIIKNIKNYLPSIRIKSNENLTLKNVIEKITRKGHKNTQTTNHICRQIEPVTLSKHARYPTEL
jgi:hypothetical protein